MSGTTEIYICDDGQSLTDGKLVVSHAIETKGDAEADAIQRCKFDPAVAKVAYYAMADDGSFRNFYTYRNPNPVIRKRSPVMQGAALPDTAGQKTASRPVKPSLWQRVIRFYQEE